MELNGRHLASMQLMEPIMVNNLGQVEWLEIMEPRPEKVGVDPVGIDHMEFVFADFAAAEQVLQVNAVSYVPEENPSHQWLSILAHGREFKLSDHSLADIVAGEVAGGSAKILKESVTQA